MKDTMSDFINFLEHSWEEGFFFYIRDGIFKKELLKELIDKFDRFKIDENENFISRRLVQLIWFIPTDLEWHKERLLMFGMSTDEFDKVYSYFHNQCERILGIP